MKDNLILYSCLHRFLVEGMIILLPLLLVALADRIAIK
jgi:hypothetical protein